MTNNNNEEPPRSISAVCFSACVCVFVGVVDDDDGRKAWGTWWFIVILRTGSFVVPIQRQIARGSVFCTLMMQGVSLSCSLLQYPPFCDVGCVFQLLFVAAAPEIILLAL